MALSALLGLKNSNVFVWKNFFGSTKLRQRSRRGCLLVALQANAISPLSSISSHCDLLEQELRLVREQTMCVNILFIIESFCGHRISIQNFFSRSVFKFWRQKSNKFQKKCLSDRWKMPNFFLRRIFLIIKKLSFCQKEGGGGMNFKKGSGEGEDNFVAGVGLIAYLKITIFWPSYYLTIICQLGRGVGAKGFHSFNSPHTESMILKSFVSW